MGLAMSRSKCRPLGSRPARFSSQISLRRPSPRRYDVAKLLLRSLSKCKLKKRRAFFHHAFTSKRAPFDPSSLCSKVAQIPSSSSLDSSWPREIFFSDRFALIFYRDDDFKVEVFLYLRDFSRGGKKEELNIIITDCECTFDVFRIVG